MPQSREPKIIIVEDDPVVLKLLSSALLAASYQPLTFASAKECLESVEKFKSLPELLFLVDVQLGDVSGLELVESLRKLVSGRFFLCSSHTKDEVRAIYGSGVDDVDGFLQKPFSLRDVVGVCGL